LLFFIKKYYLSKEDESESSYKDMEDDSCIKICVRKRPLNEKGMHIIFINIINCLIYMCITVKLIYNIHYICISYYIIILNNSIIMMIIKIIKKKKKKKKKK